MSTLKLYTEFCMKVYVCYFFSGKSVYSSLQILQGVYIRLRTMHTSAINIPPIDSIL